LYRRQDEVGTLYCVTVDVQSLDDKKVTVRDRDTMLQDRVDITQLKKYLDDKLA
ncbi:His/Gly/Thr/Pro-type tRNA ligase C-terminal domain-containing protein, partial [bacterium]|nr:His/Gly/Thr/Pro-type tRNA ligase C-terminal domain-containing protein [bacterium]